MTGVQVPLERSCSTLVCAPLRMVDFSAAVPRSIFLQFPDTDSQVHGLTASSFELEALGKQVLLPGPAQYSDLLSLDQGFRVERQPT